ncbi:MAG: SurA N-terminal domain-containing protein [Thiomonas sp.]|uniref:SurA N-terminal domain-containing protein n=1 Tax=Thiomonas sp. TaxID=2047785 RepID=UPI002A3650CF|nr:SurA N-terminal domain-containing protein [Thiomonas sp.]MDY0331050.1 SurA N-terminal domain-containing protein [Thiomonas sp.]
MLESIRKHSKLMQIVLFVLIFPSFVLFGIQGYSSFEGSADAVAKVGGQTITMQQLDAANRDEIARLQSMLGSAVDIKQLDTPEQKMRTLDGMIRQTLLQLEARREHLEVTDAQVQQAILQIPQIAALRKPDGSFDVQAYRSLIAAQGMNTAQFEAQVREQLILQQVLSGLAGSVIDSQALAEAAAKAAVQQREIRLALFKPSDYAAQVQVTPQQVEAFYKNNTSRFQKPESADIQYVVLDAAEVAAGIKVSTEQAKAYYDANLAKFSTPAERRASHILIAVPADATPAQQEEAKARAEAIAKQVKADPAEFAALARKDSQDPGSADKGGDLGYFTASAMVKPFAEAVFGMHKIGDIVGPIKTQFGYHIIELTGIKPGAQQPFDAVKSDIEKQLQQQAAQKQMAADVETFTNAVFEHPESFQPVEDKLHLKVQTASNVTRTPQPAAPGTVNPLSSKTFLEALFSENSLRHKHNLQAIQIAPNVWASARVLSYSAAQTLPFAQVQAQAREILVDQEAAKLARKAGEQALKSPATAPFGAPLILSQTQPTPDVSPIVVSRAFGLNPTKLPVTAGVDLGAQGYAVLQLDKVIEGQPSAQLIGAAANAEQQALTQGVMNAYIEALRKRFGVEVLYKPKSEPAAA